MHNVEWLESQMLPVSVSPAYCCTAVMPRMLHVYASIDSIKYMSASKNYSCNASSFASIPDIRYGFSITESIPALIEEVI